MAIAFSKYIDITSSVGGSAAVAERELIARLFTTNPLIPVGTVLEFTSADEVGTYFGTSSEEYLRAAYYFAFISKNTTAPQKISYARWADSAVAPHIYGARLTAVLATFTAIEDGAFTLTIGADVNVISGLDFSGAASLAAVAALIQAEIRTNTGTMWTSATVAYDASRGAFNFTGGSAVAATISVAPAGSGTEIAALIGWTTGAIFSVGSLAETVTDVLIDSTELTNNFGSFTFIPALSIDEIVEAATWNAAQNVQFQYQVAVLLADAASYSTALIGLQGTGVTVSEISTQYPEMLPMMILAATNYDARNSVQNYMYQQSSLTPSVTTTELSDTLDSQRINYYGSTQTAGQNISFYQRGFLMGGNSAPQDMGVYANEQWLKDAVGVAIMQLFLALSKVSANPQGNIQLLTIVQGVITRALNNGTISVGKPLSDTQKLFIGQVTGDNTAWYQVQSVGYWIGARIEEYVVDSLIEYKWVYTLVYAKDDVIRKVEGQHVLI